MRRASDMLRLTLIQDHAPNDLNAIAIKAHPDFWYKELMDALDAKYKIISDHGNFNEQKLALRSAALDSFDMLVFHKMVLEQNETDLIYISKNFTEDSGIKDILKFHIDQRTINHFMTLSFLTMSERLGDKGDWLDAYKPAIELATKGLIRSMLNKDPVTQNLAAMAKHAADEGKMHIISGKYDLPENIPKSNLAENTP